MRVRWLSLGVRRRWTAWSHVLRLAGREGFVVCKISSEFWVFLKVAREQMSVRSLCEGEKDESIPWRLIKVTPNELMTLQPSSKVPKVICFVQQDSVWNMKTCTWPSFKLLWFITARTTRESRWVYEESNVLWDCKILLSLTKPFWKPLTSRNPLLCSDVAEWVSKSLGSLNGFQEGEVCLF